MQILLILTVLVIHVIAYPGTSNKTVYHTPEMLQYCKSLGISPESCNDYQIASHQCTGGVGAPCDVGRESAPPPIDPVIAAIMIGSGAALIGGIISVRKIRRVNRVSK